MDEMMRQRLVEALMGGAAGGVAGLGARSAQNSGLGIADLGMLLPGGGAAMAARHLSRMQPPMPPQTEDSQMGTGVAAPNSDYEALSPLAMGGVPSLAGKFADYGKMLAPGGAGGLMMPFARRFAR